MKSIQVKRPKPFTFQVFSKDLFLLREKKFFQQSFHQGTYLPEIHQLFQFNKKAGRITKKRNRVAVPGDKFKTHLKATKVKPS
jgi:hypothetical protein